MCASHSLPSSLPTHAPPVSLPSIFMRPPSRSPPSSLPAPTPRASRPTHAPSVALPSTRLWHITLLPRRPCLDCLAHVLCTFWTPNPIVSAPQHSSTHHPTRVREAWTSTAPTHASFYLRTDPERPTMMLVMRPCAQRNIACRRHCAHFGHPRPYLSPATPLHSPF